MRPVNAHRIRPLNLSWRSRAWFTVTRRIDGVAAWLIGRGYNRTAMYLWRIFRML